MMEAKLWWWLLHRVDGYMMFIRLTYGLSNKRDFYDGLFFLPWEERKLQKRKRPFDGEDALLTAGGCKINLLGSASL